MEYKLEAKVEEMRVKIIEELKTEIGETLKKVTADMQKLERMTESQKRMTKWIEVSVNEYKKWQMDNPMLCAIIAGTHDKALARWNDALKQFEIYFFKDANWKIDDTPYDRDFRYYINDHMALEDENQEISLDTCQPTCHQTVPVLVWVDIDLGVEEVVKYLNSLPGVRTHASCQGTIGEGGPNPYRAQVMTSWTSQKMLSHLREMFDVESGCLESDTIVNNWGYVRPKDGKSDFQFETLTDPIKVNHKNCKTMNWTMINQHDQKTWPPNNIDVWLRDEDGNAKVALCTVLPTMGKIHCVFTGCIDSTQVLKWATHWCPATPPECYEEELKINES